MRVLLFKPIFQPRMSSIIPTNATKRILKSNANISMINEESLK